MNRPPTPAVVELEPPSLPPVAEGESEALIPTHPYPPPTVAKKPTPKMPKSSVIRKKALAIVAMRANGHTKDEIAEALGLSPKTLSGYVHKAVRAGFLIDKKQVSLFSDPKDRLDYDLASKAVDVLESALTGPNREKIALKLMEGTLFKQYDQPKETVQQGMNVLAIKIEGATASPASVTDGGAPLYIDAESDD